MSDIYMSFAYIEYPICVTVTTYSGTFVAVSLLETKEASLSTRYPSHVMKNRPTMICVTLLPKSKHNYVMSVSKHSLKVHTMIRNDVMT